MTHRRGLAVDGSGNVFVTGYSVAAGFDYATVRVFERGRAVVDESLQWAGERR